MTTTTALLLGLALGALIGALGAWALLRARTPAPDQSDAASARMLALLDERYERDAARSDAAQEARGAEIARTLAPISASLGQLERHLARTENARVEADGALQQQLRQLSARTEQLTSGTAALTTALRSPTARGRWGEVQLRRIVEAAGMLEHVDFEEQVRARRADGDADQLPDLVVRLAGDRRLAVDAKAPMDAYLDSTEQSDPQAAAKLRAAHAKALRGHVDRLAAKGYWAGLGDTPEFTVLFVPSDGVVASALGADPALLEHAFSRDIVIASPATLMALLRTVAHTWRTDALNANALEILEVSRELHQRLGTLNTHLAKLGRQLDGSVKAFNDTVGSYQSRVIPSARRIEEMHTVGRPIADQEPIERRTRPVPEAQEALADTP